MEIIAIVIGLFISSLEPNATNAASTPQSSEQQAQQPESNGYIICEDINM